MSNDVEWVPNDEWPTDAVEENEESILKLRKNTKDLCESIDQTYIDIAENLYYIKTRKYFSRYYGFEKFEDYITNDLALDLKIGMRQVYYYINAYSVLVHELGIDITTVGKIGISKSRLIMNVIDKDNKEDLLEVAKAYSVSNLKKYIIDTYKIDFVEEQTCIDLEEEKQLPAPSIDKMPEVEIVKEKESTTPVTVEEVDYEYNEEKGSSNESLDLDSDVKEQNKDFSIILTFEDKIEFEFAYKEISEKYKNAKISIK